MGKPGEKYRPSNGSEGEGFMGCFCHSCIHDNGDKKICDILTRSMCFDKNDKEYPEEWTYDDNGNPICTAHVKWDWGREGDPDDPNNTHYRPPDLDNPSQLCLPFIFDELEINQHEVHSLENDTHNL